jgi:hypothetical protein
MFTSFCIETKKKEAKQNEKLLKAKQSKKRCFNFAMERSNKFEAKKAKTFNFFA